MKIIKRKLKILRDRTIKKEINNIKRKIEILKRRRVKNKIDNFFGWIEGAKLVQLESCNVKEDPVRPELDIVFRRSYGRKIYGVKYKKKICAIMCFGFTNDIPRNIKELDLMTRDAYLKSAQRDQNIGNIAIAYTVWSKKKGGGKLIVNEVFKMIKKSNHLSRLITLSPLTEMARKFHLSNGAIEIRVNEKTRNFEYEI